MTALLNTLRSTWGSARESLLVRGVRGLSKSALDLEPVPDSMLNDRRKTCAACPAATRTKRLGIPAAGRLEVLTPLSHCSVCKCNLHAKTRLASETCPRRHW